MTNKELQNLFRKKLDNRNIPFSPEAWARMETMLDARMPVTTWYQASAKWVKGLTAAAVTGISIWFMTVDVEDFTNPAPINNQTPNSNQEISIENNTTQQSKIQNSKDNISITSTSVEIQGNVESPSNESDLKPVASSNSSNPSTIVLADASNDDSFPLADNYSNSSLESNSSGISNEQILLESKDAPVLYEEQQEIEEKKIAAVSKKNLYSRKQSNWRFGLSADFITARNNAVSTEGYSSSTTIPGWAFGFRVAKKVGYRFSLQTGLNYSFKKADGSYTFVDTDYGFGSDIMTTTVNEKSLNSLEIPLTVQYHVGLRHQLKAGLYGSYLMSTGCNVEQELDNGFEVTNNSKHLYLTETYQNTFDAGLIFGYAYSIDQNLQLGLNSWMGLTDVYTNSEFGSRNNFLIRFSLNYWL